MPSPFGEDSELCRMLRLLAPQFEHRLFLSATPHNGHTRSFTGLLEMLDPVRFSRSSEMGPGDARAHRGRRGPPAEARHQRPEAQRHDSARGVRRRRSPLDTEPARGPALRPPSTPSAPPCAGSHRRDRRPRRRTGAFAVEILGKRLLSCPTAFADSWSRTRQGLSGAEPATEKDVAAAERTLRQETGDDREAQQREATAATVAGAWLRNFADDLDAADPRHRAARSTSLGFDLDDARDLPSRRPWPSTRGSTRSWRSIERLLIESSTRRSTAAPRDEPAFRPDERLIVFTEYKATLDYLDPPPPAAVPRMTACSRCSAAAAPTAWTKSDREHVKAAFNDPASPVRVLVATDAASEGLNLHRTARYLLHYDCPWNPSRLEQRNGRIDRYGQARDVTVHHFASSADADLRLSRARHSQGGRDSRGPRLGSTRSSTAPCTAAWFGARTRRPSRPSSTEDIASDPRHRRPRRRRHGYRGRSTTRPANRPR